MNALEATIPGGSPALSPALSRIGSDAGGFDRALQAARQKGSGSLRESAEQFVAGALVTPVFAQLRESNDAPPPFGPGRFEKAFGPMLDAEMASQIVRSEGFAIVDRVVEDLTPGARRGSATHEGQA